MKQIALWEPYTSAAGRLKSEKRDADKKIDLFKVITIDDLKKKKRKKWKINKEKKNKIIEITIHKMKNLWRI